MDEEEAAVRAEWLSGNLCSPSVRSDDPHYEEFDADEEREPLEDLDAWHE